MMEGYNLDIYSQMRTLEDIIMSSEIIKTVLKRTKQLDIDNYYIGK